MEPLNIKAKDIIQYVIYLVTFIVFIVTMDNKIDKLGEKLADMKVEKKEISTEQRESFLIIQTKLESLGVTAELNKQNISINKVDIAILNEKLDKILNKE